MPNPSFERDAPPASRLRAPQLRPLELMPLPTSQVRQNVGSAAASARVWFEDRTLLICREQFKKKGGLNDAGTGSVYAYFTDEGKAVYVGQTGRSVKARLHDKTSAHKDSQWWSLWNQMRFVQLTDDMDRLVLEFLLILAYAPAENSKPKAKSIDDLLPL